MESYAPQNGKSGSTPDFLRFAEHVPGTARQCYLNPLSLRDIPLSGGMPEPAALRLQNPGASAASMLSISLTLRHGG